MNPAIALDITVGVLRAMSVEQFTALQKHVLAEGNWEHLPAEMNLRVSGHGDYVGVHLPNLFIGIERDGYTHS